MTKTQALVPYDLNYIRVSIYFIHSWRSHCLSNCHVLCYIYASQCVPTDDVLVWCVQCSRARVRDTNKHAVNCIFLFRQKLFMFIIDKVIVQVELSLSFCYYTPNCFFMFVYIINVTIVNKRFIKYFALLLTFVWFESTIYLTNLILTVFFSFVFYKRRRTITTYKIRRRALVKCTNILEYLQRGAQNAI